MSPLSSLDYISAHFNDLRILTLLLRLLTTKIMTILSWINFVTSGNVGFASVRDGPLEDLEGGGGGGGAKCKNIFGEGKIK